jgi:cell wall-associated NlpC family hydrolase
MSAAAKTDWLNAARAVNCPAPTGKADVIAMAFEYVEGTPLHAGYAYGADFNDYLGTSWKPPDASVRPPDPAMLGKLDCSGYMRMIWGSRTNFTYKGTSASLPLSLDAVTGMLPRRSYQQYVSGPGKVIIPFRRVPVGGSAAKGGTPTAAEVSGLAAGDLVFFDMTCDYGATSPSCSADPAVAIGHVGMFLGADNAGNLRFISARTSSDGPTIGNVSGWSILNSTTASSSFAKRFRAARRL